MFDCDVHARLVQNAETARRRFAVEAAIVQTVRGSLVAPTNTVFVSLFFFLPFFLPAKRREISRVGKERKHWGQQTGIVRSRSIRDPRTLLYCRGRCRAPCWSHIGNRCLSIHPDSCRRRSRTCLYRRIRSRRSGKFNVECNFLYIRL